MRPSNRKPPPDSRSGRGLREDRFGERQSSVEDTTTSPKNQDTACENEAWQARVIADAEAFLHRRGRRKPTWGRR